MAFLEQLEMPADSVARDDDVRSLQIVEPNELFEKPDEPINTRALVDERGNGANRRVTIAAQPVRKIAVDWSPVLMQPQQHIERVDRQHTVRHRSRRAASIQRPPCIPKERAAHFIPVDVAVDAERIADCVELLLHMPGYSLPR